MVAVSGGDVTMLPEYIRIKCSKCLNHKARRVICDHCGGTGHQRVHLGTPSVVNDLAEAIAYIDHQDAISKKKGKRNA